MCQTILNFEFRKLLQLRDNCLKKMDLIINRINGTNGNRGNKSDKELVSFETLVDRELSRMYVNTDCVDNYSDNFTRVRQDDRQLYKCKDNSCHFVTNKSSLIVRHIRRHLKMMPYSCPLNDCGKRFYQRCELRSHLLRHFDDKPFKCSLQNCDKTYTTRKALSLHTKSHLPFGYCCTKCHNRFATQWMLKKHIQQKHKQHDSDLLGAQHLTEVKTKSKPIHSKGEMDPKIGSKLESKLRSKELFKLMAKPKVENKVKVEVKTKMQSKPMPKRFVNLISIRDQIKEQLVSHSKAFLVTFGLEEVTKYKATCDVSQHERVSFNWNLCDIMTKIETEANNERKAANDRAVEANHQFVKWIENMGSLIEINEFEESKRHFFKCFACTHYSETIEGIVDHILKHISFRLLQFLSNQLKF